MTVLHGKSILPGDDLGGPPPRDTGAPPLPSTRPPPLKMQALIDTASHFGMTADRVICSDGAKLGDAGVIRVHKATDRVTMAASANGSTSRAICRAGRFIIQFSEGFCTESITST